jgi:PII-like signaling protein
MRVLEGQLTLMRIFIGEQDKWHDKPLCTSLVEMLRREGIAGATVIKGEMGYGAHSIIHSKEDPLRLGAGLPLVVEVVDSDDHLRRILPQLDQMVSEGLITMEKVQVIKYAPF